MSAEKGKGTSKKAKSVELSQDLQNEITQRIIFGAGYGSPPEHTRFKKGAPSPNPRGRPRKALPDLSLAEQPMLEAVLKGADKKVTMREGGKITEVPARAALVHSVYANALKGNARSQGLIGDWLQRADEVKAREIRESRDYWRTYQRVARELIAEAKAKGESEPIIVPHPDDIILDDESGARIIGPFDEESARKTRSTIDYRHAFILQAALDERLMPDLRHDDPRSGPGAAYEVARMMNRSLPPRLRLSEAVMIYKVDLYSRHPQRWLLKEVYSTWRKLGKKFKRGQLFPSLGWAVEKLTLMLDLQAAAGDGHLEIDAIANGHFDETAREFFEERGFVFE
ncbi:DUF5681 domain-containing protein [Mesorhizobium calcicola]|uniref:DUF5681 domain-containing protein n=1 Tax=Mesorhizobium calcicola TaxID=1300310 RepID=A0ABW4WDY7_9HYPH